MIDVRFDATTPGTPLPHIWEYSVGSGHAPLALRADYQAQLTRCRKELGVRHVRFHGLLSDDMGTLVCERNERLYSFVNADRIWDFLVSIGMRPIVELSFMPTTLASGNATVFSYRGNVTPPRDYAEWATLVSALAHHCVARYGVDEVRQWLFEVWNEPNLQSFWRGTRDAYFTLYQHSAHALKDTDDGLRVGGPATAQNAWIGEFLDFCDSNDLPADFVSTHHYPTDAFGHPGDDTESQLAASTRSVLRDRARRTHERARGKLARPAARRTVCCGRRREDHAGSHGTRGWLQLLDVQRHLRGELLPLVALSRRFRAPEPVRRRETVVPRLRAAARPGH
jgi:xylan 1,4-beta-xylosidase